MNTSDELLVRWFCRSINVTCEQAQDSFVLDKGGLILTSPDRIANEVAGKWNVYAAETSEYQGCFNTLEESLRYVGEVVVGERLIAAAAAVFEREGAGA